MFTSITVLPVIIFAVAMYLTRGAKDKGERILSLIFFAFVTFLCASIIAKMLADEEERVSSLIEFDEVHIVALSTAMAVNGSFFVGTGSIEGNPYYLFYYEISDGGKKLTKLLATSVTLYEEDRKDAFFTKVIKKKDWSGHGVVFDFFVPQMFRKGRWDREYAIHVPKGSIREDINLNLSR